MIDEKMGPLSSLQIHHAEVRAVPAAVRPFAAAVVPQTNILQIAKWSVRTKDVIRSKLKKQDLQKKQDLLCVSDRSNHMGSIFMLIYGF